MIPTIKRKEKPPFYFKSYEEAKQEAISRISINRDYSKIENKIIKHMSIYEPVTKATLTQAWKDIW